MTHLHSIGLFIGLICASAAQDGAVPGGELDDHPGTCPNTEGIITTCEIRDTSCFSDIECARDEKCCSIGCGKECLKVDVNLCAAVTCIQGSTCDPKTGICSPLDPCSYIRCASFYMCVQGQCIPTNNNPCRGKHCKFGYTCVLRYPPCPRPPEGIEFNCEPQPVCAPCPGSSCPFYCPFGTKVVRERNGCYVCQCKPDPCQHKRCGQGHTCRNVSGRPQCVPNDTPVPIK